MGTGFAPTLASSGEPQASHDLLLAFGLASPMKNPGHALVLELSWQVQFSARNEQSFIWRYDRFAHCVKLQALTRL